MNPEKLLTRSNISIEFKVGENYLSNYYAYDLDSFRYISHHGILGQKWGIRRYQNKDGTLTEAGKRHLKWDFKRYSKLEDKLGSDERDRALIKSQQYHDKKQAYGKAMTKTASNARLYDRSVKDYYIGGASSAYYDTLNNIAYYYGIDSEQFENLSDEEKEYILARTEYFEYKDKAEKAMEAYYKTPIGRIDSLGSTVLDGANKVNNLIKRFKNEASKVLNELKSVKIGKHDKDFTVGSEATDHSIHPKTGRGGNKKKKVLYGDKDFT